MNNIPDFNLKMDTTALKTMEIKPMDIKEIEVRKKIDNALIEKYKAITIISNLDLDISIKDIESNEKPKISDNQICSIDGQVYLTDLLFVITLKIYDILNNSENIGETNFDITRKLVQLIGCGLID